MPIEEVVVNASPLITLYKSQLADLLPQLFGKVQVPPAVWQEVTVSKDDIAAQTLPHSTWATQTEAITIHPLVSAWDLGAGESEVLSYALDLLQESRTSCTRPLHPPFWGTVRFRTPQIGGLGGECREFAAH